MFLRNALRKHLTNPPEPVPSIISLFKYADGSDLVLIAVGLFGSVFSGLFSPLYFVFYAEFTTVLIERKTHNGTLHQPTLVTLFGGARSPLNGTAEDLESAIKEDSFAFAIGLLTSTVLEAAMSFLSVSCLNYAALKQLSKIRRLFFEAVLRKDMSWYDVNTSENFALDLTENLNSLQEGIGEKIGLFISKIVQFVTCVAWALIVGWELTLVALVALPFLAGSMGAVTKIQADMVAKEQTAYSKANAVAEEAFSNIKTVMAFGGEEKEVKKYKSQLTHSLDAGIRRGLMSGIANGMTWFLVYAVYALTFWYGVTLILRSKTNGDDLYNPLVIPLVLSKTDLNAVRTEIDYYCLMMVIFGVVVGIAFLLQLYSFGRISSFLTSRLRSQSFASILKQEAAWFDKAENKVGSLCTKLSNSAADIQAIAGSSLSIVLQGVTTLLLGFAVAFTYSWEMTLISCIGLPLLMLGVYYELYVLAGQNLLEMNSIEGATKVATEGIIGIRTIASLGREKEFLERFDLELQKGEAVMKKKALMRGVIFALGQSATPISYGISVGFGGYLVATNAIIYKNVIKACEALLFGVWLVGQSMAFVPSMAKARISAGRIFEILDRQSALKEGELIPDKSSQKGSVDFSSVRFTYPSRPEAEVLKGLNLRIDAGRSIALVGASGCGKSTLVQLLQRLYDPSSGRILIDNSNIKDIPISALRAQMSIVSQEPCLFDATIAENIAYGDNSRVVSRDDIIKAAKTANIHSFITSLPLGYDTTLGRGGAQLSGGQKQRVAIARALIRNPRILLLDEATSALDAASESTVQEALDEASAGRTTITVGHRPAAIKNADYICVLDKGVVVERDQ